MIVDFFLYGNNVLKVLILLGALVLYIAVLVFETKWGDGE